MLQKIKDPASALTHFAGCAMAALAAVPLLVKAAREPDRLYFIAMAVFALSMVLLYAASTTYHTVDSTDKVNRRLRQQGLAGFWQVASSIRQAALSMR